MEALFARGEARGIHSYRDVRAALVSMMRFRGRSFAQAFPGFVNGYIRRDACWTALGEKVHSARYEDFIDDRAGELRGIAQLLELDCSDDLLRSIADALGPPRQRALSESIVRSPASRDAEPTSPDPHSLLHPDHLAAAEGGDAWRTRLTAEQVAAVEQAAGPWLAPPAASRAPRAGD